MNEDEVRAWDNYIRRCFDPLDVTNWPGRTYKLVSDDTPKPFLTAADLVMLREMKVGL